MSQLLNLDQDWQSTNRWLKIFAYTIIVAVTYGVFIAHLPWLLDAKWAFCNGSDSFLQCELVIHLWGIPMTGFNAFLAWYILKKYNPNRAYLTSSLITIALAINIVYFAYESGFMLDELRRDAPNWEILRLTSIALVLLGGTIMGIFVQQKLLKSMHGF